MLLCQKSMKNREKEYHKLPIFQLSKEGEKNMNNEELINELNEKRSEMDGREMELKRLITCYTYASGDDRKVIWAVLNKYVPMLSAEGLI